MRKVKADACDYDDHPNAVNLRILVMLSECRNSTPNQILRRVPIKNIGTCSGWTDCDMSRSIVGCLS